MKKILIAGATGFIGRHLIPYLVCKGYHLSVLTRRPLTDESHVNYFHWDVGKDFIDEKAFENVDTIINFTGANINAKRWTKSRKKEIINSRIDSINLLYDYVSKNNYPIKQFLSASAVGYYGAVTTDKVFTETSQSGNDFLASVCRKWENAAKQFEKAGGRVVVLRLGVVLGKDGGIYKKMAPLAKRGINPAVGNGKQYLPWIDVTDLVRLHGFLIKNPEIKGTFNAVASEQIAMNDFARRLLLSFDRKSILPNVPAFIVRLLLGEQSSMVLEGSRVRNDKVKEAGFKFFYDYLAMSLEK